MADDPNQPVVLTTVTTEAQAQLIVAALEERGVESETTGGFTAGFRAEAPGVVRVLVRQADLGRAQAAWREIEGDFRREHPEDEE